MKVKHIPSSWLIEEEHRLDCGPFTSGALEARKIIEELHCQKESLLSLSKGGFSGIYHVGQDKLQWVENPNHGVPLLRSADILKADLSDQPYISREQVKGNPLFQCPAGSTLITRSGTIGRMAYTRSEMAEMAISQDVLKVVPDTNQVPSGYLYAFLASRFGIPQVVGGTFGSIIVHIEAENIADLPVPRIDMDMEEKVNHLIEEASQSRTDSLKYLDIGRETFFSSLDLEAPKSSETSISFSTFITSSDQLSRLDAAHFSPVCSFASNKLAETSEDNKKLGQISNVFTPGIFKRRHVDDPAYGYPYFSGSELFQFHPSPRGYLSKTAPNIKDYLVEKNWLLIQDAGQLGGLIGKVVRVNCLTNKSVVSNHLMRIKPHNDVDAGYLFALLSSWYGYRAITRHAFGTSIPQLDPKHIAAIEIPWPSSVTREKIASPVLKAWKLQDRAIEAEKEAIALVEKAIEEAA